jgi:hypothetical protein
MLVIVPTRGRPEGMVRQIEAFKDTLATCDVLYAVDDDDDRAMEYLRLSGPLGVKFAVGPRLRMVGTLNFHALREAANYDVIGFMGDDHLPRTDSWDTLIMEQFTGGPVVVYGDDLLQGPNLATAVFLPSRMVRAMGYFAPPCLTHLYADNAWMEIGRATAYTYLPGVVIEHMHPVAGKAAWDDRYAEVNAPELDAADRDAFHHWRDGGDRDAAVAAIRKEYGL